MVNLLSQQKSRWPNGASISMPDAKQKSKSKIKIAFIENSMQFLREVKVELKKVAWPTRKQTLGSTVVVLILVIIIAFFLGIVDIGLSSLIRMVLHKFRRIKLALKWYIVHVYSGFENKVKIALEERIASSHIRKNLVKYLCPPNRLLSL